MAKSNSCGDLWRTPVEIFTTLDKEFEFVADMASSDKNALCPIHFTEEDNSLSFDWSDKIYTVNPFGTHNYVWCNPPYSNPMPWVKKALEAQLKGLGIVMLLNADHSVGWFAEALKGVSEIRNLIGELDEDSWREYKTGRVAFLDGEGNPIASNNKPQFVLVFNPYKIAAHETSYIKKSSFYK